MKPRSCFLLILGVALVIRIAYLVEGCRHNPTFRYPIIDAFTYDTLAVREAAGTGMGQESVWQPLFYPYFLSVCYRVLGHHYLPVRLIQIFLGLAVCALTFHLGRRLFTAPVGLIAMGAVAVCGPLIFFEGELLSTTWEVFWFLGSLVLFQEWRAPRGGRSAVRLFAAGIVCAAGTMIRPAVIPFYGAALVLLVASHSRGSWKRAAGAAAAAATGMALVFGPVAARNHASIGKWAMLPLSGGLNFYIGNNPDAERTVALRPGDEWYQMTVLPRKEGILHAAEGPAYFYSKSFEFIRRHPGEFLKGLAWKAGLLLSAREIPRNVDIYLFRAYSRVLGMLAWRAGGFGFPLGIIIPAALLGMAAGLRRFRALLLLYLYVVAYGGAIVLFFVSARYRAPLIPALCVFASSGIVWLGDAWSGRRRWTFAGGLALLAVLLFACNRAVRIPEDEVDFASELSMALGASHMARGEEEEGVRCFREAIAGNPSNDDAHNLLGAAYLLRGDRDGAERELERALQINPRHVGALVNLARLQRERGDWEKAADIYARAVGLDPGDAELHEELAGAYERLGDPRAASLEYWKALELEPGNVPIRRRLAMLSGRGAAWATSRELIEEAIRHDPENATLHCDFGVIYGNMGLAEEAIAEFRTALRLKPNDPASLYNLVIMYRTTGDATRARELYERLKTADPAMAERMKSAPDAPLIPPPSSGR